MTKSTHATPQMTSADSNADPEDKPKTRERGLEDELRDPKYFLEYFLPRPLRLTFFAASALGCLIALLLGITQISAEGTQAAQADGTLTNLLVNGIGLAAFVGLFLWDRKQADVRLEQRTTLRQAQIKFGDRCPSSLPRYSSATLSGRSSTRTSLCCASRRSSACI